MANEKTYKGQWSSEKAEAKYRAKESVLWDRAEPQPEPIDVATSFGSTRAYRWSGSGPPVVFLHGMTDCSVRWIPFAQALAGHDVYAIDIMGDVGHSKPDVGFSSAQDYATWLGETLDALGIAQPHLVGSSLGGYIAFSYAMTAGSVASVIGLDPVGIVDLKLMRLMRWSLGGVIASFAPASVRGRLAHRLRQPLLTDEPAMALLLQAQHGHPVKIPPLPVFTDEQLQSITAPVFVLAGEDSRAFDVQKLVGRIKNAVPRSEARLLPDAGHGFPDSHLDDCVAMIREAIAAPVSNDQGPT